MAIGFVSVNIIGRKQGQSSVAAAAYRSGTKLYDERRNETHNYSNRKDVSYNSIMLPEGADINYKKRSYLWNTVEANETKSNARLSKDIVIALPNELSHKQNIELARRFAEEQFVSKGLVADLSIHNKERNPHCHILITTRRLLGNKFDTHKARDLDGSVLSGKYGKFVAGYNVYHNEWRETQNRFFEEKNINLQVDQNYLLSQLHEGKITNTEISYIREANMRRLSQAHQIALNNPDYILSFLTKKNTVFSINDIESIAYKHSKTIEEYQKIKRSILENPNIISLGKGLNGKENYTTEYAFKTEQKLLSNISYLNKNRSHYVRKDFVINNLNKGTLREEQKQAIKHLATDTNDISVVIGKPGTGKSYMLSHARELWEKSGYKVRGTSLSGIAAYNLYKESGIKSRTLHSLNYCLDNNYISFNEKDILVVDEAGMIDTFQMAKLVATAKQNNAKIVLVGDPEQLQPIGPGAPLRAIAKTVGYIEMNNIRRQKKEWMQEATYNLSKGDISGIDSYKSNNRFYFKESVNAAMSQMINEWNMQTYPENLLDSVMISHRNMDVNSFNNAARTALKRRGIIDTDNQFSFSSNSGIIDLSKEEKILFLENNKSLGVQNGTFGIVKDFNNEAGTITVSVREGKTEKEFKFSSQEYNKIQYGYAATVHKLQGATVKKAYLYLGGKYWNKNLILVGCSRHEEDLKIYADKETFSNYNHLKSMLSRAEFKDSVLNYPLSFSLRRGFDPESAIGRFVDYMAEKHERILDKWLWVANKEAYLERQQHKKDIETFNRNKNKARVIGKFNDIKNELLHKRILMTKELKPGEKLYSHDSYCKYYAREITLNKLGAFLYNNYEKYEAACQLNNIGIADLKPYCDKNAIYSNAREYLNAFKQFDREKQLMLAPEIKKNYREYFKDLKHLTTNENQYIKTYLGRSVFMNSAQSEYDKLKQTTSTETHSQIDAVKSFADKLNTYRNYVTNVNIDKSVKFDAAYVNSLKEELSDKAIEIKNSVSPDKLGKYFDAFSVSKDGFEKWLNSAISKELELNDKEKHLLVGFSKSMSIEQYAKEKLKAEKDEYLVKYFRGMLDEQKYETKLTADVIAENKSLMGKLEKYAAGSKDIDRSYDSIIDKIGKRNISPNEAKALINDIKTKNNLPEQAVSSNKALRLDSGRDINKEKDKGIDLGKDEGISY